jgi:serine/threonine protein phosphatase PrpC
MKETVKVDTRFEVPAVNDTYVLCSDGFSGPVTDDEIADILATYSDLTRPLPQSSSRAPTSTADPTTSRASSFAGLTDSFHHPFCTTNVGRNEPAFVHLQLAVTSCQ